MKNLIITILIVAGLLWGFIAILSSGLEAIEVTECLKWQEMAERFEDFYLLEWEAKQCEAVGVEVIAPIKK